MSDNNQTIGPLYQKVKDHVVNKIAAGELLANARVPSENELVERLGVSRMTANRALKELATEGLVTRIAGVGTFVAAPRTSGHLLEVRNIAEEVRERGHNYSNRVVSHRSVAVTPSIVAAMELTEGVSEVYHSLIVHLEDGRRLQVEERLVNAEVAPDYIDIDLDQTTPAAYLLAKLPLHKVEHTVRAAMPSASIKKFLQMADNVPCLILDRRTWSSGTLVSVAHLYHCAQSFSLTETLQKDG